MLGNRRKSIFLEMKILLLIKVVNTINYIRLDEKFGPFIVNLRPCAVR